jgi:predicted DNA-binding transcriptional regulator YafY
MNRTDRLYAIVEELRAAGTRGVSATTLAERFEVATRTIKRDVAALQQAGVPIWSETGRGGGYVLDAATSLPPVTFTTGEAIAIAVALAGHPHAPFAPDGRSALTKLVGAMSPADRDRVERLAARVWIRDDDGDVPSTQVTRVIDEALRDDVVIVLDYVDRSGRRSEKRPVEPLAYARTEGHWYLLAWCRRRRDGRWFRLDRIQGAWPTHEPFRPRDIVATFGEPPDDSGPVAL